MSPLEQALNAADVKIFKYRPGKQRPVVTNIGTMDTGKFHKILMERLGAKLLNHPEIVKVTNDPHAFGAMIETLDGVSEQGEEEQQIIVPPELKGLTLNIDRTSKESGTKRFFLTTEEGLVTESFSGSYYIDRCRIPILDAVEMAKAVVPKYMPRRPRGITRIKSKTTLEQIDYYNMYIPPEWEQWKNRNPKEWAKIPAKPPALLIKFLKHLLPLEEERRYLYAWINQSLVSRVYVYLVLSGVPGSGKNRLNILLRALHGNTNAANGKKETFGSNDNKFNGQMEENTLIWFDELKYNMDMEPRLKEYQNDLISIERKGIDATKSTEIYPSMVISNNYARDNYLPFDSRKFAPLVLADRDLKYVMSSEEISELSDRIDVTKPTFDVRYVAQIAKWIQTVGPKYEKNWRFMEYKGPKFWEIAHSSMSRWQKIAVMATTSKTTRGPMPGWDESRKAFLWSKIEETLRRKRDYESKDYRDATTVRAFFDSYRDHKGEKVFETEDIGKKSALYDFWIKPLHDLEEVKKMSLTGGTESGKATRPPGMSMFQWRKHQEEMEKKRDYEDL